MEDPLLVPPSVTTTTMTKVEVRLKSSSSSEEEEGAVVTSSSDTSKNKRATTAAPPPTKPHQDENDRDEDDDGDEEGQILDDEDEEGEITKKVQKKTLPPPKENSKKDSKTTKEDEEKSNKKSSSSAMKNGLPPPPRCELKLEPVDSDEDDDITIDLAILSKSSGLTLNHHQKNNNKDKTKSSSKSRSRSASSRSTTRSPSPRSKDKDNKKGSSAQVMVEFKLKELLAKWNIDREKALSSKVEAPRAIDITVGEVETFSTWAETTDKLGPSGVESVLHLFVSFLQGSEKMARRKIQPLPYLKLLQMLYALVDKWDYVNVVSLYPTVKDPQDLVEVEGIVAKRMARVEELLDARIARLEQNKDELSSMFRKKDPSIMDSEEGRRSWWTKALESLRGRWLDHVRKCEQLRNIIPKPVFISPPVIYDYNNILPVPIISPQQPPPPSIGYQPPPQIQQPQIIHYEHQPPPCQYQAPPPILVAPFQPQAPQQHPPSPSPYQQSINRLLSETSQPPQGPDWVSQPPSRPESTASSSSSGGGRGRISRRSIDVSSSSRDRDWAASSPPPAPSTPISITDALFIALMEKSYKVKISDFNISGREDRLAMRFIQFCKVLHVSGGGRVSLVHKMLDLIEFTNQEIDLQVCQMEFITEVVRSWAILYLPHSQCRLDDKLFLVKRFRKCLALIKEQMKGEDCVDHSLQLVELSWKSQKMDSDVRDWVEKQEAVTMSMASNESTSAGGIQDVRRSSAPSSISTFWSEIKSNLGSVGSSRHSSAASSPTRERDVVDGRRNSLDSSERRGRSRERRTLAFPSPQPPPPRPTSVSSTSSSSRSAGVSQIMGQGESRVVRDPRRTSSLDDRATTFDYGHTAPDVLPIVKQEVESSDLDSSFQTSSSPPSSTPSSTPIAKTTTTTKDPNAEINVKLVMGAVMNFVMSNDVCFQELILSPATHAPDVLFKNNPLSSPQQQGEVLTQLFDWLEAEGKKKDTLLTQLKILTMMSLLLSEWRILVDRTRKEEKEAVMRRMIQYYNSSSANVVRLTATESKPSNSSEEEGDDDQRSSRGNASNTSQTFFFHLHLSSILRQWCGSYVQSFAEVKECIRNLLTYSSDTPKRQGLVFEVVVDLGGIFLESVALNLMHNDVEFCVELLKDLEVDDREMKRVVMWSLLGMLATLKDPNCACSVGAYCGGVISDLLNLDPDGELKKDKTYCEEFYAWKTTVTGFIQSQRDLDMFYGCIQNSHSRQWFKNLTIASPSKRAFQDFYLENPEVKQEKDEEEDLVSDGDMVIDDDDVSPSTTTMDEEEEERGLSLYAPVVKKHKQPLQPHSGMSDLLAKLPPLPPPPPKNQADILCSACWEKGHGASTCPTTKKKPTPTTAPSRNSKKDSSRRDEGRKVDLVRRSSSSDRGYNSGNNGGTMKNPRLTTVYTAKGWAETPVSPPRNNGTSSASDWASTTITSSDHTVNNNHRGGGGGGYKRGRDYETGGNSWNSHKSGDHRREQKRGRYQNY